MGVVTLSQLWENYRRARKEVKTSIMKEKKEVTKRMVRKIRENGDTGCKLFWIDLRGKEEGEKGEKNER